MANIPIKMATRNVAEVIGRSAMLTSFQLHIGKSLNVIDFTEYKLIRYAAKITDVQQKTTVMTLIDNYRAGLVAIAWRRGAPVPLKVTRESK